MPHPGHFYGLLNEPDPDPPWPPTRLPPSLIAAADEWAASPEGQLDPRLRAQQAHRRRAMAGEPGSASIAPTPSRASSIWEYLQHKLPRQAREAVQGGFYGTGAGALRIGQALIPGEQPRMAQMEQFGLDQIPEEGIGAATGVLGSFAPEFTLAGDLADLGRIPGHLGRGEWGGAALSALAAVPIVGTPAAGLLKARRGVRAATEAAGIAQEAARAAQEERMIERVAARYSPERPTIGPEVVRDPELRGVAHLNRSELQALLKERGLPATGTNDSLRELADIVAKNPRDWTRAEFDRVRPHISVHQDMKGADLSEGILEEGLTRGMVDPASGLDPGASGWSWGGHLQGGPGGAYLFWPGDIRYKPSSPYIERATPFMHIAPERGEDLYDAIRRVDQSATGGLLEVTEAAGPAQEAQRAVGGAIDELSDDTVRRILYANDRQGEWEDLTGPELREAFAVFEAEDPAGWAEFLADPSTRLDVPELRTGASPPSVAEGTPLVAEIGGDRSLLLTRNTHPDQGPWRITPVSGETGISRGQHWSYQTYDEAAQALAGSADNVKPLGATGGLLEVTEAATPLRSGELPAIGPEVIRDPELASLSERARELDPTPSTVRAPRTREGLQGVRTAGTPGRGIASVRELDQTEAVRQASRGAHLVRGTGGQYVGAPRGLDSPGALRALRSRLDKLAAEGEIGRDWYDRTEAGNLEIAGPHADRTALASAEQGLWSAGANPDVNLGFAISGHNAYEAGAPIQVGRWPSTQGQRYLDARDAGGLPDLGPKTGVYGGHLDPFVDSPITGTNDIWHARAFGYTNADGSEFSRGLSPQEHAFMDAETLLSAERMNASRGTDVWDGRGSQAAIWVRMKGADLAERKGLTLQEGLDEAMKSYPEYFDKNTLSATYEAFPGVDTGHLPGIQDMTWAERQAYTDEVPWTTQAGNDVFADALGMYSQRTVPGTGYFEGLINPNRTARPLVARSAEQGVDPRDAAILAATQATRGLLDAQNASAWHHVRPDAMAGQQTSAVIGLDRAATPDEMRALENLSEQHIAIDTGTGVTLMADPDVAVSSRDVLKRMEREWKPAISDAGEVRDPQGLPYGPPRETHIPGATSLDRVGVDSNYQSLLELKNAVPGGAVVTDELLRLVDEADALAPTTSARLSAPSIRHRAGLLAERDDLLADIYGGVREDLQNFRRIFAEKGLAGIRAAREAGVALPAWVLAFLGANELRGEREGG